MRLFKITVIGSSVALRIRPSRPTCEGKVFAQLLAEKLESQFEERIVVVDNKSISRALITEVEFQIDRFIQSFPDLYVINIGAVDAPTREIPLWYSDIIFKRSCRWLYTPFKLFHTHVIGKYLRKTLVFLRGYRPWVSPSRYLNSMESVLKLLQKETDARIIVLGINTGSDRVEQQLPGTRANYQKYSSGLRDLCSRLNVPFVDVSDLSPEDFFPDGVHYNQAGHELIANRILDANGPFQH